MKNWLKRIGSALLIAALSAIVTNLITGQPLIGLVKLKGLSQALLKSTVPAWAFALTFFVALFGTYQFTVRLLRRNRRGKVHFVPDAYNNGWAPATTNQISLRAGGTFTYEGEGDLTILRAWLTGTQPTTDFMVNMAPDGSGRTNTEDVLWLQAGTPVRAFIYLNLTPMRGTLGKPLRGRLIFRDKYNRDYALRTMEFPYTGRPVQEQTAAPSSPN